MFDLGDRVFSRVDPDRKGTVVRVYSYPDLVVKDWVDVKWDTPTLPHQFGDVTSIPTQYLEKA